MVLLDVPERGGWRRHGVQVGSSFTRSLGAEMSVAGHSHGMPDVDGPLPAFVERAQQDAQWQAALARAGYRRVKAAYARQLRKMPKVEIFYGIEHLQHWPTMEFVRDWLKAEKRRGMGRVRWTFMAAMLATIVAVATFWVAVTVMR
jgi:hypothetical protein